jgi:hypothetical protein
MRLRANSSDCCSFCFLAHFLQVWAACPLPENCSFVCLRPKNVNRIQLLFDRFDFFLELLFRDKDELTEMDNEDNDLI